MSKLTKLSVKYERLDGRSDHNYRKSFAFKKNYNSTDIKANLINTDIIEYTGGNIYI